MNQTADSNSLKVAAAKRDITPDAEVFNWVTGKPYTGVLDPIFARVLVLSDEGQKAVIVHWEIVDAGESATAKIREKIAAALNIPEDHIVVNAAHNHSAPWAPVYGEDNHRGKELDPWWATRYMPRQNEEKHYKKWMQTLMDETLAAAIEANGKLSAATIHIGRYDASQYMRNRRPRPVKWGIESSDLPSGFNYKHQDWDPNVLSGDRTFGPLDRTLTVISFRNEEGENISSIFHMSCHAVSIYPFTDDISGDWSGSVTAKLNEELGGENMFLQGTAGDINPWKRGPEAVQEMATGLTENISKAYAYSAQLKPGPLQVNHKIVGLPLTDYGKEKTGLDILPSEVQAITIGSLAIVTLPGEPMTGLGMAIREVSPFPHTIVLGYSNGNGGHYCGMPGEKEYGGYEIGEKTSLGSDNAGLFLVRSAIELLNEIPTKK
ncbi:hypothetical protein [Membranihabitans marinus]|uniref:hypothetical protein n=1 Tax=Membranihabitans marinus TaxID=1227546 RepID=UPI001F1C4409|nr:hypothetical protein [Membranihabitans marinus]